MQDDAKDSRTKDAGTTMPAAPNMLPVEQVVADLRAAGRTAAVIRPPTAKEKFREQSTVIVCPTKGMIHYQVASSWHHLVTPMNAFVPPAPFFAPAPAEFLRAEGPLFAKEYKVAEAYNALIEGILATPNLARCRYVLTVEDDNILPWDALLRLLEVMEQGPKGDYSSEWDGVSALYYVKDEARTPMVYGDPEEFRATKRLHFKPWDLSKVPGAEDRGDGLYVFPKKTVVEVTGIAQGCALFKMDLFRELPAPWFVTVENQGCRNRNGQTQDLYWSQRLMAAGKRLAVALDCYAGHVDPRTGEVY